MPFSAVLAYTMQIVQQLNRSTVMDMKLCPLLGSLLSLVPCGLHSMTVHILNEEPVHVIPGSNLVLKARIQHGPLEDISLVTWEREPETGVSPQRVTLATCPGRGNKCVSTKPNVRMDVEQQETTLQINGYAGGDSGVYAVTVTDHTGAKTTAHCIVRIYGKLEEFAMMSFLSIRDKPLLLTEVEIQSSRSFDLIFSQSLLLVTLTSKPRLLSLLKASQVNENNTTGHENEREKKC